MKPLTARQKAILEYIKQFFTDNCYWPSIRDIQKEFGFKSTNGVMGHLHALERKEYLQRNPGQARVYRFGPKAQFDPTLTHAPAAAPNTISLPIYGSIAAGYPDQVESSEAVGTLQIDVSTANVKDQKNSFALKVRGESMIDAGIFDGDIVIVERGQPRDRDIVAALIDGETTLKRYMDTDRPYLKAENQSYPDLLPITDLLIQGVARSIVRCL